MYPNGTRRRPTSASGPRTPPTGPSRITRPHPTTAGLPDEGGQAPPCGSEAGPGTGPGAGRRQRGGKAGTRGGPSGPVPNRTDNWMEHTYKFGGSQIKRKTIALILMGIPGLLPMFFMSRAIIDLNQNTLQAVEADVFGTGSMLLLILTLTVTPLTIVSRQRWFVPLRKWYGIALVFNATTDGVTASIVNQFRGGVVGGSPATPFCWSAWSWCRSCSRSC